MRQLLEVIRSHRYRKSLEVIQHLVEAQVVLDGVRGVEDGTTGGDNQDKTVESLWVKQRQLVETFSPAQDFAQLFLTV